MEKIDFEMVAYITHIGKIETYNRKDKTPLSKIGIDLETKDGQKLFAEIRYRNFEKVSFMRAGMAVVIGYEFAGSEKGGKKYNNIIINEINMI